MIAVQYAYFLSYYLSSSEKLANMSYPSRCFSPEPSEFLVILGCLISSHLVIGDSEGYEFFFRCSSLLFFRLCWRSSHNQAQATILVVSLLLNEMFASCLSSNIPLNKQAILHKLLLLFLRDLHKIAIR